MSEQTPQRATAGLPERRKRRQNLTDKQIAGLPRRPERYIVADPEQRGLYLRVPPEGPISFTVAVRDQYGRKPWVKIGSTADMGIETARERAREVIRRIKDGLPAFEPVPEQPASYRVVAEKWLALHVAREGLRSQAEIERLLRKFVFPVWGKRDFADIKRRDINDLLDAIAKDSAWNADHVLAIIRKLANWYATRDDDYVSPFVKGMRRTRSEVRARDRILDDKEVRAIWRQAEANGTFGALVRILLLTAQRRGAVVGMKWSDITSEGVWEIATEAREKGNAGALRLPERVLTIINAQPRVQGNDYIFAATRGNGPLDGFNKRKAAFDKSCGVADWTLHDLRRTARSLMSRAGVSDEHAEHALGHKLQGVKKVYNRYDFFKEKSDALARLAALIERIVNPPADNVLSLQPATRS
jgi:integrase